MFAGSAGQDQMSTSGRGSLTNQELQEKYAIDTSVDFSAADLTGFNVAHPSLFVEDKHWAVFDRLREEQPLHYCADSQFGPYWSVTRYEDIKYVDSHHEIFSSDSKLGGAFLGEHAGSKDRRVPENFINMDPPEHSAHRKSVAPYFAGANLKVLEVEIRTRATSILDGLPVGEEFNWVSEVSVEITSQILATLFQIPQEDRHKLIYWTDVASQLDSPELFVDRAAGRAVLDEMGAYFAEYWRSAAQSEPKMNLISLLAHDPATADLDAQHMLAMMILLVIAGNDTTRNSMTGGVLALNRFPDEYTRLLQNPTHIPSMVPEIIRYQTPVAHMARTATQEVAMHGQTIKEGDRVAMWYISGNRDQREISDPYSFQIDRAQPRKHLSFGFGIHRCLGNRLAEMQLRIVWEEITKRFGRIEMIEPPTYIPSSFIHGISELTVVIPKS